MFRGAVGNVMLVEEETGNRTLSKEKGAGCESKLNELNSLE
jgi:hypothetical protein